MTVVRAYRADAGPRIAFERERKRERERTLVCTRHPAEKIRQPNNEWTFCPSERNRQPNIKAARGAPAHSFFYIVRLAAPRALVLQFVAAFFLYYRAECAPKATFIKAGIYKKEGGQFLSTMPRVKQKNVSAFSSTRRSR